MFGDTDTATTSRTAATSTAIAAVAGSSSVSSKKASQQTNAVASKVCCADKDYVNQYTCLISRHASYATHTSNTAASSVVMF
jgi:hypothetical protein